MDGLNANDDIFQSLYKLDYEDIVGGIPCRFKYKNVQQEDYGLSVDDILMADDKSLNKFVGLKKLAPYYKKKSGADDSSKWSKKRRRLREEIKEKLGSAELIEDVLRKTNKLSKKDKVVVEVEQEDNTESGKTKRTRRKKKEGHVPRLMNKHTAVESTDVALIPVHVRTDETTKTRHKNIRKSKETVLDFVKKRRLDLYQ